MKRATAYQRKKQILIHASSRTTEGVWILDQPCIAVLESCSNEELGRAVQSALDGSKENIPHPHQWGGLLEPLLKAANVKSWKTFSKGASCVEVEQTGERLIFTPTVNRGADEGYEALEAKRVTTTTSADSLLGSKLREALAQAE